MDHSHLMTLGQEKFAAHLDAYRRSISLKSSKSVFEPRKVIYGSDTKNASCTTVPCQQNTFIIIMGVSSRVLLWTKLL